MTMLDVSSLEWAHPLVQEWFLNHLGNPTEPQIQGWPLILAKKPTLISAPTGSGKTFAAFLTCIDQFIKYAIDGNLKDNTQVLYISPLKALGNDIEKNLMQPLTEIAKMARNRGLNLQDIRVSVRSGDTPTYERQKMLKKPPHILVTTPESLYILLTAEKSREMLKSVHTVIIDEIHAMVNDKRGAHLALSLERLEHLTHTSPLRIGLSATQKPLALVGKFLVGNRPSPAIVNVDHKKQIDLNIIVPSDELSAVASNEMWEDIYKQVANLTNTHKSTLIFTNTRRLAERLAHHLQEHLGSEKVAAHHGSLSKKLRITAENKLKNGELKALVATASLELGIDIGSIDLVCQIGSPRSIAVMLQRIGRAGHWHSAISKGRLFATTRDELIECAALVHAINSGDLDSLKIPDAPLDVLAQQIVAMCAASEWTENELFKLVKQTYHYKNLSLETFNQIIDMLSQGIAGTRARYGAYLFHDQINKIIKGRRQSRLIAITSGGAIPDSGLFSVVNEPNGHLVGTLDEDFAVESHRGDIILLGSTSWKIRRIEGTMGRVLVEDAHGAPPTVPFWRGEAPERTPELSLYVSTLRQKLNDLLPKECSVNQPPIAEVTPAREWLEKNCNANGEVAGQIIEYILLGRAILTTVPTQKRIVAERFFDESGGMQLIIHAPFGARINKAWGLALRKCFCRSFNLELQASATDDGINIALTEVHSFPLNDVFKFLNPRTIQEILIQAILQSPLFATRWRWDASRALAIPRFRNGRKVPPHLQRMRAEDLLAAVFPDAAACQDNLDGCAVKIPDHPLVNETIKDCLTEALNLKGLIEILKQIKTNKIQCVAIDTPTPSAFAHEILNANPYAYLDDAPLEERRARAVEMRRILPSNLLGNIAKLDLEVIKEVKNQAWPDIRNEDELQDFLQTVVAFPRNVFEKSKDISRWEKYLSVLIQKQRVGIANVNEQIFWIAVEKLQTFTSIYPEAILNSQLPVLENTIKEREENIYALIQGWIPFLGPISRDWLSEALGLNKLEVEHALLKLENSGQILRGYFTTNTEEWCDRRLLARIHKLTLGKLRKEIAPVNSLQFVHWLMHWQHVAPQTQLSGEQGVIEIIKQLQGFEIPAKAWEKHIFSKRLRNYDSQILDRLCLMGLVGWGRINTSVNNIIEHNENSALIKKISPSSITPITFFLRENSDWFPPNKIENSDEIMRLSHIAKRIYTFLKERGASFSNEIFQELGHLKTEIENGLWELVAAGLATADSFDNLRALIDPKRRLGKKKYARPLFSAGRWSLLKYPQFSQAQRSEAICWLLLKRYGVVFRDLIIKEKIVTRWRDLLIIFRRLEERGEIRGGRFVDGFLGEQFALPYAVQSLRQFKKNEHLHQVELSAVDPLNLIGIILPGPKISATVGKQILM